MPIQTEHLPGFLLVGQARRVPDVDRLVFAGRDEPPPIQTEGNSQNVSGMWYRSEKLAGRHIPENYVSTETRRGQPSAVRAERQRADGVAVLMRGQGALQLVCFSPPDGQALFPRTGRRQAPTVPTVRHGDGMVFGSGDDVPKLAIVPVPDPYLPLTSRRQVPAVGRSERHGTRRPERANGVALTLEHRPVA